jgi:glycosyltransferase involved in cell wall biosynthesis
MASSTASDTVPASPGTSGPAYGDLVSVIIPSYNMGRYLPKSVASVLGQTYSNFEVIIVDDGSSDDTQEVVRQWDNEPRVRVHRQANGGLSHARNQGIAHSSGPFIALLDADDIWLPQKLSRQMLLFRDRPQVGVVFSGYERMDDQEQFLPMGPTAMYRGKVSGRLFIENFVPASSAVVRRECFERCGGFDVELRTGEDYEMWLRLSAKSEFDFVPEPLMRYRIWGGQMSRDYRGRYETAIRVMQRFLDRNPGVVDNRLASEAWAHTYTGRGNATLWRGNDRGGALRDYLRALSLRPAYWPAWKAIVRAFVKSGPPT